MEGWEFAAGAAALAVAGFAARRPIRRLYAPPHGGRALALTWIGCLSAAGYGWTVGPSQIFLGLCLLTGGAFVGIMASALWKEERSRAAGLPDDHTELPERLGWLRRMAFGMGAAGAAWVAYFMTGTENPGDVLHAWGAVVLAATLGAAALTGRPSKRLRRQLGAELTPEQAEELRRRSQAHRLNPEEAIPLDEALRQLERGIR